MTPLFLPIYLGGYYATKLLINRYGDQQPDDFNMESYQKNLDEFSNSMQFSEGLACKEVFSNYTKQRASSISDLENIELGKSTLQKAIFDYDKSNGNTKLLDSFNDIFELNDETKEAQKEYESEIKALDDAIKDPSQGIDPAALDKHLQDLKSVTKDILDAQHRSEVKRLEKKFKDKGFTRDLCKAASVSPSESKIKEFKESFLEKLKEKHQKQTDEALAPLMTSQENLHNRLQQDRDRIHYLAAIYRKDKEMRQMIDELAAKNAKEGNVTIDFEANENGGSALFKGIDLKDLDYLKTATGRKMEKHDDGYRMDLPRFPSLEGNPLYYSKLSTAMKKDMQSMATAIRAGGNKSITMNVNHGNPEQAIKMAQVAYDSCLTAGFEDSNTTITVNGREMKVEEIFKDNPSKLQQINQRIAQQEQQRTQVHNALDRKSGSTDQYKKGIRGIRDEVKEKERQAAEVSEHEQSPEQPQI